MLWLFVDSRQSCVKDREETGVLRPRWQKSCQQVACSIHSLSFLFRSAQLSRFVSSPLLSSDFSCRVALPPVVDGGYVFFLDLSSLLEKWFPLENKRRFSTATRVGTLKTTILEP